MHIRRAAAALLLFCLIPLGLSSCSIRRNRIIHRLAGRSAQPLLTADKTALIEVIAREYNAVRDFSATVDMTPALGSAEKNKITEYKDVRGYILFRKPAEIRIIGLFPVVRSKAFDMVSGGADFKLYIPSKNRFIVGKNEIEKPSPNKLENLRPEHFLEALLVRPIAPGDKVLMENFTDEDNAFYILHEVRENGGGQLALLRTIWFNRLNLTMSRQLVFDDQGNILTDARYDKWQPYDNVPFPQHIEINRPRDEYGVVIDVVKMDINKGVTDDKFVLTQPEGSTLQVVGQGPLAAPPAAPPPGKKKT
ncbi:MAG: DUF4292 domain-containing protein [Acidobacteriia bacterium]|nr:DUF4292 domain-containing protein [Terriglobia bacterium]